MHVAQGRDCASQVSSVSETFEFGGMWAWFYMAAVHKDIGGMSGRAGLKALCRKGKPSDPEPHP